MDRLYPYALYFLVVISSINNAHESITAAQSMEPYSTSNMSAPSSSSDMYTNIVANDTTEDSVRTTDFYATTTIPVLYFPSDRPDLENSSRGSSAGDTSTIRSDVVEDESSTSSLSTADYTSTTASSINDQSLGSTKDVRENANDATEVVVDSLARTTPTRSSPEASWTPRDEEMDESLRNLGSEYVTQFGGDERHIRERGSADMTLLHDVVTTTDYTISAGIDTERNDVSMSELNGGLQDRASSSKLESTNEIETSEKRELAEKSTNDLEDAEDRYGAVFPYLDHRQFLRARYWPIYRRHPYNNYLRYPIFPGR